MKHSNQKKYICVLLLMLMGWFPTVDIAAATMKAASPNSEMLYDGDDAEVEAMRKYLLEGLYSCEKRLAELEKMLKGKATEDEAPKLYEKFWKIKFLINDAYTAIYYVSTKQELENFELEYLKEIWVKLDELRKEIEEFNSVPLFFLNAENFPDANFRKALASELGISEGDAITEAKIAATTWLNVSSKQIADLTGIEHFTALTTLYCYRNQLTSLDVSKSTALTELVCFRNQIKGEEMDALVASLPTVSKGDFWVIDTKNANEENVCTKSQVSVAKEKGWTVYDYNGSSSNKQEYEGSEDAAAGLLLNAANFPDANFRAALASQLKISEGDEITKRMILMTHSLKIDNKSITDLAGIEYFTELVKLSCAKNQLMSLDLSKNTELTELYCQYNQLTSLDVSNNAMLTTLYCSSNQLTSLDVSNNAMLTTLYCSSNQLTSLDVSNNAMLTTLYCSSNQLTSLDVSGCTALTELSCTWNQLTSLDVSGCTALTKLTCYENRLTSLDASGCTALTELDCRCNKLTSLDVSGCITLKELLCTSNKLVSLDVSRNTMLTYLACEYNQLTSLDVSNNTALTHLYCYNNQLTSLNVSRNTALTNLSCWGNQLTLLDVSKNTALETLFCDDNQLSLLDVSKNAALTLLSCGENQLTSLDVSKNTALKSLYCYNNQLTSLDVSNNTALTTLSCGENQLTSLDVSKNTALQYLYCYNNQLTSLDVSKNTALTELYCYSNKIKGEAMDALVTSLPAVSVSWCSFYVIDTTDENEGNVCTKSQVAVAKEKGWTVYNYNGSWSNRQEYEGSDDPEQEIDPVDEGDNIDYGNDMDENSDLDGNVIGDIYYNINTGNGGYDAAEGCIVVTKPTDDGTVDDLEGKDIFGEDFKSQFTGIVFKVPAGKGTIKVDAETTGNMLLKVKIGSNEPVEMELNGKLKVTFPYNVSEATYVYIYAGAANEAKGFGKASARLPQPMPP